MTVDRRKYHYLQWVSPLITIVTLIIGAVVWVNTMSGIPPRVTKAEERISELEKSQARTLAKWCSRSSERWISFPTSDLPAYTVNFAISIRLWQRSKGSAAVREKECQREEI